MVRVILLTPIFFAVLVRTSLAVAKNPLNERLPSSFLSSKNTRQHRHGKSKDSNGEFHSPLSSRGGGEEASGGSTMLASVFNLVNNVAGAGILTLAGGMSKGTSPIPAVIILALVGILASHTFQLIGNACEITGEKDFKGLWSYSLGDSTTYVIDVMIAVMCTAASVTYSGILGDVFTPLLSLAGVPDKYNMRKRNILLITVFLLFPLGLVKNLSGLAFTSILGFTAILYTVVFLVIRAVDGTYSVPNGGKFVIDNIIKQPKFPASSPFKVGFASLILVCNLAFSFIAHYNSPAFYRELKDTSVKKFGKMVNISYLLLIGLYTTAMLSGYFTFGKVCEGNILLNYHPSDILSTFARLATGFSILFGYPLLIAGVREATKGAAASLGFPQIGADKNHVPLVFALFSVITAITLSVDDISLVVGITGSLLGSCICFICPSLLYIHSIGKKLGYDSLEYKKAKRNSSFVPFGIAVAVLGAYMTLKEAGII